MRAAQIGLTTFGCPGSGAIPDILGTLLGCAMGAAEQAAPRLDAMADHPDTTVFAARSERVDGALKAVEGVSRARRCHLDRLVVVVAADLALRHEGSSPRVASFFRGRARLNECGSSEPAAQASRRLARSALRSAEVPAPSDLAGRGVGEAHSNSVHAARKKELCAGIPSTERRWNRTIQAEGCSALPVLKTVLKLALSGCSDFHAIGIAIG